VERIAVGDHTACVVTNRGGMYCWGDNALGAAGHPDLIGFYCQPWRAPWHACIRTVAFGGDHACGLTYDGRVLCWGQNNYGQLGVPEAPGGPEPVEVPFVDAVIEVAADGGSAALLADRTVWLWGACLDSAGACLDQPQMAFTELADIKALPSSGEPQCAVTTSGALLCWGRYSGNGTAFAPDRPVAVAGLEHVAEVSRERDRVCARLEDGTIHCWGHGPVGDGSDEIVLTPVQVAGIETAVQVSVGSHACALAENGDVLCWGNNLSRGCGQPGGSPVLVPTVVQGLPPAIQVGVGRSFTCALTADREVYCWGANYDCTHGTGKVGGYTHVPQKVLLPTSW